MTQAPRPDRRARGRPHLQAVKDDRRCRHLLDAGTPRERRCRRWSAASGAQTGLCGVHTMAAKRPKAAGRRRRAVPKVEDPCAVLYEPVFDAPLLTQDDVQGARLKLMRQIAVRGTDSAHAILLTALGDVSEHIERYGSQQGSEGGRGVFRLLPGTTLVMMHLEEDRVLTKAQLEEVERRMAEDDRAGRPVPKTWPEIRERYLGLKSRPIERSRNWQGDDDYGPGVDCSGGEDI
jgi:hypothetical protein